LLVLNKVSIFAAQNLSKRNISDCVPKNVDLILDCFTKNGIYQESPLTKPYREHKKIKKSLKK